MTGALSTTASICASVRGDCAKVDVATWHSNRVAVSYTRYLVVVLSAYQQICSQSANVLGGISEDNFDPSSRAAPRWAHVSLRMSSSRPLTSAYTSSTRRRPSSTRVSAARSRASPLPHSRLLRIGQRCSWMSARRSLIHRGWRSYSASYLQLDRCPGPDACHGIMGMLARTRHLTDLVLSCLRMPGAPPPVALRRRLVCADIPDGDLARFLARVDLPEGASVCLHGTDPEPALFAKLVRAPAMCDATQLCVSAEGEAMRPCCCCVLGPAEGMPCRAGVGCTRYHPEPLCDARRGSSASALAT
ncbi:uncharacterized protein C8Q71DRAFT_566338 [Rhodofomes roseus]|uniref:C3H1-type domain-containing protein n=1 Tax=Rhodofomes roseus TaxID=34475 RepID=A0ABQ8KKB5_9APHY|nr:uncharacterized protein C8Q71DRAFT_566338 [Rhodofomes roseus]KAH9837879.1 hypothetical protein C8Q71DRAFT_566338 [Rhodofomes roseus]